MTTILFDLDGTLINTTSIVLPAFKQTLTSFGQNIPDDRTLQSTFGMPDDDIWKMLMPTADEPTRKAAFHESEQAILAAMFRTDIMIPHAREVLDTLKDRGHTLTTASNCGAGYLNAVLDSQGLRALFTHPLCLGTVEGTVKADILQEHFKQIDKRQTVMVGDRSSDVEAARSHGIPVIGCSLGFGTSDELADADLIVYDLRDLLPLFPEGQTQFVHSRHTLPNHATARQQP